MGDEDKRNTIDPEKAKAFREGFAKSFLGGGKPPEPTPQPSVPGETEHKKRMVEIKEGALNRLRNMRTID